MPERSHRARDGPGYRPDGLRPVVGQRLGARTIGLVEGRPGAEGVPISLAGPCHGTSLSQVPSRPQVPGDRAYLCENVCMPCGLASTCAGREIKRTRDLRQARKGLLERPPILRFSKSHL